jgi:hypothetical protein
MLLEDCYAFDSFIFSESDSVFPWLIILIPVFKLTRKPMFLKSAYNCSPSISFNLPSDTSLTSSFSISAISLGYCEFASLKTSQALPLKTLSRTLWVSTGSFFSSRKDILLCKSRNLFRFNASNSSSLIEYHNSIFKSAIIKSDKLICSAALLSQL